MQVTEQLVDTETISGWLRRWAPLIPGGEVLDLACGSGRHARHLVSLGHPVIALDHDPEILEKAAGPGIVTSLVDLEAPGAVWPFAAGRFAGIVVTNYLHRPLFEAMIASLRDILTPYAACSVVFETVSLPAYRQQKPDLRISSSKAAHGHQSPKLSISLLLKIIPVWV